MGLARPIRFLACVLAVSSTGLLFAAAAFGADEACQHSTGQYVLSQNRNCFTGWSANGNHNFDYLRYTDDWATENYNGNYNIYVRSSANTCHETGSSYSCQTNPSYWWKCVSSVFGYSHPSSFQTAYNYPRLVFVGNTETSPDYFAEWAWDNPNTNTQGPGCSIF